MAHEERVMQAQLVRRSAPFVRQWVDTETNRILDKLCGEAENSYGQNLKPEQLYLALGELAVLRRLDKSVKKVIKEDERLDHG